MRQPHADSASSCCHLRDKPSWRATGSRHLVDLVAVALLIGCQHSTSPATPTPISAPAPTPQLAEAKTMNTGQPAWIGCRFDPGTTRVNLVVRNSPCAAAGIRFNDQFVSLDGVEVHTSQEIVKTIASAKPGTEVKIALTRGGTQMTVHAKLGVRPSEHKVMSDTLMDKPAPAFTAPMLDGSAVKISDLRGKVVLLDFWATWCGPCESQFPHLNRWHKQFAGQGLSILALSDEEGDVVRKFVKEVGITYPVALDPNDRVRAAYMVPGMPTTVIIDKQGVVRYLAVGMADPAEIEVVFSRLLK